MIMNFLLYIVKHYKLEANQASTIYVPASISVKVQTKSNTLLEKKTSRHTEIKTWSTIK
jgi:hypothetical protein